MVCARHAPVLGAVWQGFDIEAECASPNDLDYSKASCVACVGNSPTVVNGAPEQVVENERKKEADALAKIAVLEESHGPRLSADGANTTPCWGVVSACLDSSKRPCGELRKEYADLLARAHKMSTVDRAKSTHWWRKLLRWKPSWWPSI